MNESLLENVKEAYRGIKVFGIILSILMVLLGIAMFFIPLETTAVMLWVFVIGLLIRGIDDIVTFCKLPKGARDGAVLALGIIWIIISIFFIISAVNSTLIEGLFAVITFQAFMGIILGAVIIFNGIDMLCSTAEVRMCGGSVGLAVFGGILSILVGLFMFGYPLVAGLTMTLVYGIFLIVSGISLFCRAVAMKV